MTKDWLGPDPQPLTPKAQAFRSIAGTCLAAMSCTSGLNDPIVLDLKRALQCAELGRVNEATALLQRASEALRQRET